MSTLVVTVAGIGPITVRPDGDPNWIWLTAGTEHSNGYATRLSRAEAEALHTALSHALNPPEPTQ